MNTNKLKLIFLMESLFFPVLVIFLTLILTGRIDYWQGWIYNVLNCVFLIIAFIILSNEKDLIEERLKPNKGIKKFDRVYIIFSIPLSYATVIISILDAGRFGWEPRVPVIVIFFGIIMYVFSQSLFIWAMKANRFFSTVVHIFLDRGHKVCKEGPYRFVRHPGYVGAILFAIATPFVLGSFWGLIPALVSIIMLFIRTYLEDKTLQKELPGYYDYTKEVRSRLIPGIW